MSGANVDEAGTRGSPLPLVGKRIIVTRPRERAGDFASSLEALGAEVLLMPTIRIVPPVDPEPLRRAAREPDRFDWILFTSVNGVAAFWSALREAGLDTRSLAGVSLCAIGPATASAIELEGARADLIPKAHIAEGVVAALAEESRWHAAAGSKPLEGMRILLPQAEGAREVLARSMRELGAKVVDVVAYRTVADRSAAADLQAAVAAGEVDMITFTSGSTVQSFVDLVGTAIGGMEVATIGPVTSEVARGLGLRVDVEANPHTAAGLTVGIVRHYAGPR